MYLPAIDRNKCTNCLFCVNICPKNVLEVKDSEVEVENPALCNGCEACVVECPEVAITVRET